MRRRIGMALGRSGVLMIGSCRMDLARNNGCECEASHKQGDILAGFT